MGFSFSGHHQGARFAAKLAPHDDIEQHWGAKLVDPEQMHGLYVEQFGRLARIERYYVNVSQMLDSVLNKLLGELHLHERHTDHFVLNRNSAIFSADKVNEHNNKIVESVKDIQNRCMGIEKTAEFIKRHLQGRQGRGNKFDDNESGEIQQEVRRLIDMLRGLDAVASQDGKLLDQEVQYFKFMAKWFRDSLKVLEDMDKQVHDV